MFARRNRAVVLLVFALFISASPSAHAQAPAQQTQTPGQSALSVSPAIVDNSLDPGAKFTIDVSLANQTFSPVAVRSSTRELTTDQPIAEERKAAFNASSWFTIESPDFILLAQERRSIKVNVVVPQNAEPGGHYATVNFDSFVPEQQNTAGATTVNARVGVVVLLAVSGDVRERVSIVDKVHTKTWQPDALPTNFDLTLRNEGNVHVLPQGRIVVRDVFGRVVKELPLPVGTLLPGADRTYSATWEHGLTAGVYNAEVEVVAGTQQVKLGPATKRFVIAPLVLVIPVGVALVLIPLLFGIWRLKRKRRKKRDAEAAHAQTSGSSEGHSEVSNVSDS